jgi:hypothetical protein
MMPDILLWLGITRIDWLLSMSSDKYDAITAANIEVMQRVPLPDSYVPKNATVEISAKISAGYHSDPQVLTDDTVKEVGPCKHITLGAEPQRAFTVRLNPPADCSDIARFVFALPPSPYCSCATWR